MRKQPLKLDDINTRFFAIDNTIYLKRSSFISFSFLGNQEIYRDKILILNIFV